MKRCSTCGIEKATVEFSRNRTTQDGLQARCKECAAEAHKRKVTAHREAGVRPAADMKRCGKCGTRRSSSEFSRSIAASDGLVSECKECVAERWKRYYAANEEQVRARQKASYVRMLERNPHWTHENYLRNRETIRARGQRHREENPETVRETNAKAGRKWAKANKDKIREKAKRYSKRHPERVQQRIRGWRVANKERINAYGRKWLREHPEVARARRYRRTSAEGSFTALDITNIFERQKGRCVGMCSGSMLSKHASNGFHVDHIIPISKGGSNWPENLQLLCPKCNMRKGAMLPEEWAKLLDRLFV